MVTFTLHEKLFSWFQQVKILLISVDKVVGSMSKQRAIILSKEF
jgi:hypothetical protein